MSEGKHDLYKYVMLHHFSFWESYKKSEKISKNNTIAMFDFKLHTNTRLGTSKKTK